MSVINQMLQDLERRRETGDGSERPNLQGLRPVVRRRRLVPYLAAAGLTLAALTATAGWLWDRPGKTAAAAAPKTTRADAGTPPTVGADGGPRPGQHHVMLDIAPGPAQRPAPPSTPAPRAEGSPTPAPTASRPERPSPAATPHAPVAAPAAAPRESTDPPVAKSATSADPRRRAHRHYRRGRTRLAGDPAAAAAELRAALRLDPALHPARTLLAGLLLRQGDDGRAGALLREGLALDRRQPDLARLYARLLVEQGELDRAVAVAEAALPAAGRGKDHALLGALHQRRRDHERAASHYRAALAQDPQRGAWWLGLAIALDGAGRGAEALGAYRRARQAAGLTPKTRSYAQQRIGVLQRRLAGSPERDG